MDLDYIVIPALILLISTLLIGWSIHRIRSPFANFSSKRRRVTEGIFLSLAIVLVAAIATSTAFNALSRLWFRAHNPPAGETYTVGGYKMHIHCTGSGSPTLVLDAGLGNDSLIWGGVQPALSKNTKVCSYDRAGFGASQSRPAPRDANHIADELHGLLQQANIPGPIVLMGHSISGIYERAYATRYPNDLAGLVFVDGSTPMQQDNPAFKASGNGPPLWVLSLLGNAAYIVGLPRLMGVCSHPAQGFDAHAAKLQAEDSCEANVNSSVAEMRAFEQSGTETVTTGPYGSLPILIFSQDPSKSMSAKQPSQRNVGIAWNQMQEYLKKLSTHSRRIIAKGSTHYIQIDRSNLIEKEVPLFIQQIRGTAPQPSNFGSTTTE